MKQVLIKQGQAHVEDVPAPEVAPGQVLVAVEYSCISAGTEMSGVVSSGEPLWKRALKQPENVKKVMQAVATQGVARTKKMVQGQLQAGNATGYSAAGRVLEVGAGVQDILPGERVACAGAGYAHHAEVISVPENLVVKVPDDLDMSVASTVTLGAIALQGVRRLNPTLGECIIVVGLGILGQLVSQMLRANGVEVIGLDLDAGRIALAQDCGLSLGLTPEDGDAIEQVKRLTDGNGADGVVVTAATPSSAVISQAFQFCRKKGRVVLVGDVGLDIKRADIYTKELDFLISCSYGPGRYDAHYEEQGLDYPIGYVRWTENRNMQAYLRMCAKGDLMIEPLISATHAIEKAQEAYESLKNASPRPLIVLLQYDAVATQSHYQKRVVFQHKQLAKTGQLGFALIGAGGFAKAMHLQNMQKLSREIHLQAIVSRSGHNAASTAKQFEANYGTTDYHTVLQDEAVDAVVITTRHHLHVDMVLAALQAGKHVLVEKPLAMSQEGLAKVKQFYSNHEGQEVPLLLVGYNRRFSRYITPLYDLLAKRTNPMIINYRMNAGFIPLDHWVHGAEGGGRNLGEACHIYDLFTALTGSEVVSLEAQAIAPATAHYGRNDNFVATMRFADGSVATLTYTALGHASCPKEQMDIFVDGKVLQMNDYKSLTAHGCKLKAPKANNIADKGQLEEMQAFVQGIQSGEWPIPYWQLLQSCQMALDVERLIGDVCAE
jgi:predicted dehydrogenase/threonine dehydrogenase-like Zn-dependent dehydrogenase